MIKWLLTGIAMSAFVAQPASASSFHQPVTPSIRVFTEGEAGSGSNYLPPVDGYRTEGGLGGSWEKKHNNIEMTYHVIRTKAGSFKVAVHYKIIDVDTNPISVYDVDRVLPVWQKQPAPSAEIYVQGPIKTFACMSDHPSDN